MVRGVVDIIGIVAQAAPILIPVHGMGLDYTAGAGDVLTPGAGGKEQRVGVKGGEEEGQLTSGLLQAGGGLHHPPVLFLRSYQVLPGRHCILEEHEHEQQYPAHLPD